jgi:hypothetical protein
MDQPCIRNLRFIKVNDRKKSSVAILVKIDPTSHFLDFGNLSLVGLLPFLRKTKAAQPKEDDNSRQGLQGAIHLSLSLHLNSRIMPLNTQRPYMANRELLKVHCYKP